MDSTSPGSLTDWSTAPGTDTKEPWWKTVYGPITTLQDDAMDEDQMRLIMEAYLRNGTVPALYQRRPNLPGPKPPIFGSTSLRPGMDEMIALLNIRNHEAWLDGEELPDITDLPFEAKLPNPVRDDRYRAVIETRKGLPLSTTAEAMPTTETRQEDSTELLSPKTPYSSFSDYVRTELERYGWQEAVVIELLHVKYARLAAKHPLLHRAGWLVRARDIERWFRLRALVKRQLKDLKKKGIIAS
ncbi:hypothetical protein GGS26DRAFT_590408 [Hypomontagnella submonticulosa]|nr:hypothetical protein GGS26DRAFT_590408 [Hypomontagnella submonticulosa]